MINVVKIESRVHNLVINLIAAVIRVLLQNDRIDIS